jgi:hypothetical protein
MEALLDACAFALLIAAQVSGVVYVALHQGDGHFSKWRAPFDG